MSTLSHSRLFKASRRFIVAEVTLIIVIVVLFTWSSYVLYKLFANDLDSLFGFSLKTNQSTLKPNATTSLINQAPLEQISSSLPAFQQQQDRVVDQARIVPVIDGGQLQEQLASYKEQILRELLARQQRLLGDDNGDRLMSSLLGFGQPAAVSAAAAAAAQVDAQTRGKHRPVPDIRQVQRWRSNDDGDYLFEPTTRASRLRDARFKKAPSRQPPSGRHNSLVYLEGAPSLMQLSPSNDLREPDASNIDTVTTTTTTTMAPEVQDSPTSESQDEEQQTPLEETQSAATTTETPPNQGADSETTTVEPSQRGDEEADGQQANTTPSPQAEADPPPDQPKSDSDDSGRAEADEEERVKNTVKSIDEEVDRMTQPSLGMASRQDRPETLPAGTVHFDDLAPPADEEAARRNKQSSASRTDGIVQGGNSTDGRGNRRQDQPGSYEASIPDLLTADDAFKSPRAQQPTDLVSANDYRPSAGVKSTNRRSGPQIVHSDPIAAYNASGSGKSRHRKAQAAPANSTPTRVKRSSADIMDEPPRVTNSMHRKRARKRKIKRSDDDDDEESDEDIVMDNRDEYLPDAPSEKRPRARPLLISANPPQIERKQSLSNDPSFEELLAHKQLLDALQQNQLPSPIDQSKAATNATAKSHPAPTTAKKTGKGDEPQSADTHYSVDHGLLLFPAADEEHHHKSKSHKSSKASKKKGKKKMTMAVKKGGHKMKKHKKEEKKYHKEKKFKGAKKGKKMKKGKGGKGGKKGKKLFKDKGYKKKGFKKTYVKNEFGSKKSYFDEFRDKDFKKKWKNFDDKYKYAQMKKWQAKDVKKAKKMKDHGSKYKKYDKGKWKKKKFAEMSSGSKKSKSKHDKGF